MWQHVFVDWEKYQNILLEFQSASQQQRFASTDQEKKEKVRLFFKDLYYVGIQKQWSIKT